MRKVIVCASLLVLLSLSWPGWRPTVGTSQEAPLRLANLEIDMWPEFDQPSMLVILRGELAEITALPAEVSLRIPTSAGRPAALAHASSDGAGLIDLAYNITDVQVDFTTVEFSTPDRFFQLEFYDGLLTDGSERSYAYVWLGDLAVGELLAQVQEPASATDLAVVPELQAVNAGAGGLSYQEASLGSIEAGNTLTISVRYTKSDPRTSVEILNLDGTSEEPPDEGSDSILGLSSWLLIAVAVIGLSVGATILAFVLFRTDGTPETRQDN
jgi:hypothetical protein